jgi:acetyl esterase
VFIESKIHNLSLESNMTSPQPRQQLLPGRLGDPFMSPETDPRLHPQNRAFAVALGMNKNAADPTVTVEDSTEKIREYFQATEREWKEGFAQWGDPHIEQADALLESWKETIPGTTDGAHTIDLYCVKPKNAHDEGGPLPTIVHTHGGAMTCLGCEDYTFWREHLAMAGAQVIGVQFRNTCGEHGSASFPGALEDILDTILWLRKKKTSGENTNSPLSSTGRKLNDIASLIVHGESGGGNLCCSTALFAHSKGYGDLIDGIYSSCPMIAGPTIWRGALTGDWSLAKQHNLLSMMECDGYMLNMKLIALTAVLYDGMDSENPLAYPLHASKERLQQISHIPHHIVAFELDPLRDEAIQYARHLAEAGVPAICVEKKGMMHAADMASAMWGETMVGRAAADVVAFAKSLIKKTKEP